MEPILFILGPSGAGKTTLGDELAREARLLHINFDQHPLTGVDEEGLRDEWVAFYGSDHEPQALAKAIRKKVRARDRRGAAVSCPSGVVLRQEYLQRLRQLGYHCVILYGTREECIASFLKREEDTGRRIGDRDWWMVNNAYFHSAFGAAEFDQYRLAAFVEGEHRPLSEIVAEVQSRLNG